MDKTYITVNNSI